MGIINKTLSILWQKCCFPYLKQFHVLWKLIAQNVFSYEQNHRRAHIDEEVASCLIGQERIPNSKDFRKRELLGKHQGQPSGRINVHGIPNAVDSSDQGSVRSNLETTCNDWTYYSNYSRSPYLIYDRIRYIACAAITKPGKNLILIISYLNEKYCGFIPCSSNCS